MKSNEFYSKFANLPIGKRLIVLDRIKFGDLTAHDIYTKIKEIDETVSPWTVKKQNLLKIAEEYFPKLK